MPDTEYFIPIYKTCPECKGETVLPSINPGTIQPCRRCGSTGVVKVLIELAVFADVTNMDDEARSNLYGYLREA